MLVDKKIKKGIRKIGDKNMIVFIILFLVINTRKTINEINNAPIVILVSGKTQNIEKRKNKRR